MAIAYPRALPSWLNFDRETRLELLRDQSRNERRNGTVQVVDRSDPRWMLEALTVPLNPADSLPLEAWLQSLSGSLRDFIWVDLRRRLPQAYPGGIGGMVRHGGGAFDGTATVTAISETGVTLSGLPSTFELREGDAVGLEEGDTYGLHTILEGAVAVAGVASLTVDPFVKTNLFTTAATARLVDPRLRMMLTDRDPIDGSYLQSVRFSAVQVVA